MEVSQPSRARPRRASRSWGGGANIASQDPPNQKVQQNRRGIPAGTQSAGARQRPAGDEPPPPKRLHTPNTSSHLGVEGRGDATSSSARQRRAARARGGPPITPASPPPARPGPGQRGQGGGPLTPAAGANYAHTGEDGKQTERIYRAQAKPGRRGVPPQMEASPSAHHA